MTEVRDVEAATVTAIAGICLFVGLFAGCAVGCEMGEASRCSLMIEEAIEQRSPPVTAAMLKVCRNDAEAHNIARALGHFQGEAP